MPRPRKSLQQMAADAQGVEPMQIAGKPAAVCPGCGCAMFVYGTRPGAEDTFRYVECRNSNCRRKFISRQQPAKLVREIGDDDEPSSSVPVGLTIHRNAV